MGFLNPTLEFELPSFQELGSHTLIALSHAHILIGESKNLRRRSMLEKAVTESGNV